MRLSEAEHDIEQRIREMEVYSQSYIRVLQRLPGSRHSAQAIAKAKEAHTCAVQAIRGDE